MSTAILNSRKWIHLVFGTGLLISFFFPWVAWKEFMISGYYLPSGRFFGISAEQFKLANPFPQLNFGLLLFWLLPILLIWVFIRLLLNKKPNPYSSFAGALSLAAVTVFILFSQSLVDLGVDKSVSYMLKTGIIIQLICATGFILSAYPFKNIFLPVVWLLAGPLLVFIGYKTGEKFIMNETFTGSDKVSADYTIAARDLLYEFNTNDKAANEKYLEKMLIVNGVVSNVERLSDSTTTIQFSDSTGSYIVFALDKNQFRDTENINAGDLVSLKGSCSGSIHSQILGTTSISFKRSTIIK